MYSPLYRKWLKMRQNCCITPYTADTHCPTGLYCYTAIQRARIQPRYTGYSLYTIQPYMPILWDGARADSRVRTEGVN